MLLTLLGALVLAAACCGVVMAIFRATGRKTPKGLLALTAGLAMIGFTAWNENSWFSRQVADLPDTVQVVRTGEFSNFIQPWTLIVPRINRYLAVDTNAVISNEFNPSIKATEVIIAERYAPTRVRRQLVNCETSQAADFAQGAQLDAQGIPVDVQWFDLEADDPLIAAVCP